MDPSVQVALVSVITTLIATSGIIVVAFLGNKKERGTAAESAVEATLRERITLKDEQIADCQEDLAEERRVSAQLREEIELRKEGKL